MKIKALLKTISLLSIATIFLFVRPSYAATNISMSPSSGTVGDEFELDINVNTGTDEINGISLDVNYTGDIELDSTSSGNLGCNPIVDDGTAGVVSITCFINPGDSFEGSGTLVTLIFAASDDGSVVFDIDNVDIAGSAEGTVSGATLTVDMEYTGGTSGSGDELPETGFISDNIFLIVGGVFLVVGVVIAAIPETWNWMTLKKKQEAAVKEKFEEKVRSSVD